MSLCEHFAGGVRVYCADCRDILPVLGKVDAVITDPPYPDYHLDKFRSIDITMLSGLHCRQFIFWSPKAEFPLDYSAIHIWHKTGSHFASYERIFERNGGKSYLVFEGNPISNPVMAQFARDEWCDHPSQKPVTLLQTLIKKTVGIVFDPFMGTGSSAVAAVKLRRKFVGVEIELKYFDIACRRIEEASKQFDLFLDRQSCSA
jgi:DNA modification methylase